MVVGMLILSIKVLGSAVKLKIGAQEKYENYCGCKYHFYNQIT